MLSILIVDDEVITRKGIRNHVNWEKLGVDKIYDASNAMQGLQMAEEYHPDLILSDVCMPGMNGIEMCTKIRESNRDCQIIFLSGYSDKEYLKSAISLGAVNYVEKPIDLHELEASLNRAAAKQLAGKQDREKTRQLESENQKLIQRRLVERLSSPGVKREYLEEDFKKLGIDWRDRTAFLSYVFRLCPRENNQARNMAETVQACFEGQDCIGAMREGGTMIYICAFPDRENTDVLTALFDRVRTAVEKYDCKKGIIYCAKGICVDSFWKIPDSCQLAETGLKKMYFFRQSGIETGEHAEGKIINVREEILGAFTKALAHYQEHEAMEAAEQLHLFMVEQKNCSVSSAKAIYFRFLDILFKKAVARTGGSRESEAEMAGLIWEKLYSLDTLELCQDYLVEETQNYFQNVEELNENNRTILQTIFYIQAHYQDVDLCLEHIAESVYLSPNYLSSLFRKKMGKTITQYIADARIQYAKELLEDGRLRVCDVAVKAGYKDANYFTKIFKKTMGQTPLEYREKSEC